MTYDLHGQWDAGNGFSQEGCDTGNCLRSQVNLTETKQSLAMITKAGVPGNKVIVGVTSYGRSYNMAEAGCWEPSCLYTGDSANSHATKGKCTATAGYIADAEITEIIKNSKRAGRVVKSFVDTSSNSDVLVYDDTQWVSYMSTSTKKTRAALYSAWGFGGTTDWASDLQSYNDVPKPAESWNDFKQFVRKGKDPRADHTRNGNWTKYYCDDVLVDDNAYYTPTEQWVGLDADSAWEDAVRVWRDTDKPRGFLNFSASVSVTLNVNGLPVFCERIEKSNCNTIAECGGGMNAEDSGPAAMLVWNSLVSIHQMYDEYLKGLSQAASTVALMVDDLQNKFVPIPPEPDHTWDLFFIDLLTLGTLSAAGPFFNSFLKTQPFFSSKDGGTFDTAKDTAFTLIGQSTTIAKDLLTLSDQDEKWTPASQAEFSSYLGQVINGWDKVMKVSLKRLFSGDDASIEALGNVISGGKLVFGMPDNQVTHRSVMVPWDTFFPDLRANIAKSIFGFAIPSLWSVSRAWPFVIDAGYDCDARNPLKDYLSVDTMKATGACVDGKLYYLASPEGEARVSICEPQEKGPCQTIYRVQKFKAPKGLEYLDGKAFGGITVEDLIKGSVRTYNNNGGKNGARVADANDQDTVNDLFDIDVTTPGFIRMPVCSPERAFQSWDTADKGSTANYPCDIPPGRNDCQDSTFIDETTEDSDSVDDCRQIIKNIQGDATTDWTILVVGHKYREIARSGACSFGIEASKTDGNVNFVIGGQDVIDIINTAIERYGSNGKIAVKGQMSCKGNDKGQATTWYLY